MTIALQFLRLQRGSLFVWLAVAVLLTAASAAGVTVVAGPNPLQDLLRVLPPGLQRLAGGDMLSMENPVDGFVLMKVLYTPPLLYSIYGLLTAAAIVAREQERRTIDFLLALPVDRMRVLMHRFTALVAALTALYLVTWLTTVGVLEALGHPGSYGRYLLVLGAGLALNTAQAALFLLFGLHLREYSGAVRWGMAATVGTFLLNSTLQVAEVPASWRWPTLYGAIDGYDVITTGQWPWAGIALCLALTFLALWAAGRQFAVRQFE